ncbi:NAD(P)-binding protein, partial [Lindgomyces ingoldianus]
MPSASASEYQIHGQTRFPWTDLAALQNLRLNTSVPKPDKTQIPPGHVLVRIRAAALNARDMMVIAHDPIYPGPHVPDLEVATKGAGGEQGTLREYGVLPDNELILAPPHLTFEELAAMPACGATAMHALFCGPKKLKPGQTVLAMGTGGVSCFVIQLAHAIGATVIATSSTDAKLGKAIEMGAAYTVNYTTSPSWSTEVLRLTHGLGVDLVVDIGGATTLQESVKAVKRGGQVSLVGFLGGSTKADLADLVADVIFGGKTLYGVFNFTAEMTERAVRMVGEKEIRPVVEVFEWEQAREAFEMLSKQVAVGKIVVKV